jgi:hypothetical protein
MNLRTEAIDFYQKAKQIGFVDEIEKQIEERKHHERLAVIAELSALPPIEKTQIPALSKAAVDAHRALELAQEAYMKADRKYKESSSQLYGAQLQFDGARSRIEQRARELAPKFMVQAYEDLSLLDGQTQGQFRYEVQAVGQGWFGARETVTTSNGEALIACRNAIAEAQKRLLAMMVEPAPFEDSQPEVERLVSSVLAKAFELGVSRVEWAERRKPIDHVEKAQASAQRASQRRQKQISTLNP